MPQRTNAFQTLVSLLEAALRDKHASVTPSKNLIDKITGEPREVDVVVELQDAGDIVTVGVEVRGGEKPRRATVEWVECMWSKHQNLPTDKLVLVAKGGFTKAALKKANWLGVTTLTLEQAKKTEWPERISGFKQLRVVTFMLPILEAVTVVLPDTVSPRPDSSQLPGSLLVDAAGNRMSTAAVVYQWLSDPARGTTVGVGFAEILGKEIQVAVVNGTS